MYTPKSVTHGDLPHWHMGNAFVFITFRLADSLPVESLRPCKALERQWNEIFNANPTNDTLRNQYYKERAELINNLLDQSLGSCILKDESIRQIVVNAIHYFDNKRYHVCDYVIMPNHVHMLIETFENIRVQDVLHSIKRFSAQEINKHLNHTGEVWQRESFDRFIRNSQHYWNVWQYIMNNPRNLPSSEFTFYTTSLNNFK